jgi:non-specific protein-tyrosine kinase
VLVNRVPLQRVLQPIAPALDVLPSGLLPPNPSELLGSNRMVDLVSQLRATYDVVLIDTPPLLPVTDAAVLAPRADGVLLLVRHGSTAVQDVLAAKDALHAVSGRILGSVLTMAPLSGKQARNRSARRNGPRQKGGSYAPRGGAAPGARSVPVRPPTVSTSQEVAVPPGEDAPREAGVPGQTPPPDVTGNAWPPSPVPRAGESAESGGQALDGGNRPLIR